MPLEASDRAIQEATIQVVLIRPKYGQAYLSLQLLWHPTYPDVSAWIFWGLDTYARPHAMVTLPVSLGTPIVRGCM